MKNRILMTKLLDNQIALFYLGQEGFLIKYRETYIMLDGYLSDYVDRHCSNDTVNWVRNYPAPIKPEELDFVDYVFCSHGHFDHADPETLSIMTKINKKAKYIIPAPITGILLSYGIRQEDIIPARDMKELVLGTISVIPIASAHEELHIDKNGDYYELGYKLCLGDYLVYHAGDCCIYEGLEDKISHVDIAMLPINGRDYYRLNRDDIIGNMNSSEALELNRHINTKLLIPMHFDLYNCNGVSAASFVQRIEENKTYTPYHIFQPGERYLFSN